MLKRKQFSNDRHKYTNIVLIIRSEWDGLGREQLPDKGCQYHNKKKNRQEINTQDLNTILI